MLDPLEVLAHHEEPALGQEMVDVGHAPGEAVLAGKHGEIGVALAHRLHRCLEALARQRAKAGIGGAAGEIGIGAGAALESDGAGHSAIVAPPFGRRKGAG